MPWFGKGVGPFQRRGSASTDRDFCSSNPCQELLDLAGKHIRMGFILGFVAQNLCPVRREGLPVRRILGRESGQIVCIRIQLLLEKWELLFRLDRPVKFASPADPSSSLFQKTRFRVRQLYLINQENKPQITWKTTSVQKWTPEAATSPSFM